MVSPGDLERPRTPADAAEITAAHPFIREGPTKLAYQWQTAVLGPLEHEPWPAAVGTVDQWATSVWGRCAPRFLPYGPFFTGVPVISIVDEPPVDGSCNYAAHTIRLHSSLVSRAIVLHELCHALIWWDGHGQDYVGGLAWLWRAVFRIHRSVSINIAADMALPVNVFMPEAPSLRTRFVGRCSCSAQHGVAVAS